MLPGFRLMVCWESSSATHSSVAGNTMLELIIGSPITVDLPNNRTAKPICLVDNSAQTVILDRVRVMTLEDACFDSFRPGTADMAAGNRYSGSANSNLTERDSSNLSLAGDPR
jgi:hypothetical protein